MAILDSVRQLKQQGYNDSEIIKTLQEQGVSPREINDALAQTKIKEAISQNSPTDMTQELNDIQPGMEPSMMIPSSQEGDPSQRNQNYQDSAQYPPQDNQAYPAQGYGNQTQGYPGYDQTQGNVGYDQTQGYPGYDQAQGYGDQTQGYGDQNYGNYYGSNTDTVSEIASQIIDEKMTKTNKIIKDLIEFKTLIGAKVDRIDERLNRIESIIDQLQTMLMRKATEQEQNIEDIKTEMIGMQKGFGKIINPLVDKSRETEPQKHRKHHHKTASSKKSKK